MYLSPQTTESQIREAGGTDHENEKSKVNPPAFLPRADAGADARARQSRDGSRSADLYRGVNMDGIASRDLRIINNKPGLFKAK